MMTSAEIRQAYLDFFKSKGHQIVPSAPIVVKNDPTLLFTNAGMNQFKDYFLGNGTPVNPRIADTQKCLRVSGKHNDLEEVGVDTYHHTMFEMLGNWSFGDYFKKEAIAWSWELLTSVYKIPVDRLYVTVFEGDEKEGLPPSTIALTEWKKIVAEDHIVFGNKKDNFWEMGDTGPCGPCTEIHVDMRPDNERAEVAGRDLVNKDHPQVIEIWNNVFMQFNRLKDGTLKTLPAQHVDTGMGFERLVRVIQGKTSNYDTDVFTGTIAAVETITNKKYDYSDSKEAIAFRVLADHIRAISFTIADGQLPNNTGAGYVIRRILRRAVRYYYSYLDYKQPLLHQLLPLLATQFENVFPELKAQLDFVSKVVREEEDAFLRTLDKGLTRIDYLPAMELGLGKEADKIFGDQYDLELEANKANIIHAQKHQWILKKTTEIKDYVVKGNIAFELYDTYGFPLDLTKLIASEKGWIVDEIGFEESMQQQKNRSRAATAIDAGDWFIINIVDAIPFVGYTHFETTTKVCQYRKVTSKGKEQFQIVLGQTPFYAESGGQVGDKGKLVIGNYELEVVDTKKENGLTIHFVETLPEDIDLTKDVIAIVNTATRVETSSNHSATHLLHAALRKVLGIHVAQKGSLVNDEQLRFDFSHFAKVTDEEIAQVEAIVNEKIRENIPVVIKEMNKDEAVALGAMALFGEKYGDVVRVVIMDAKYSIELCGGTHIGSTGELGFFKIKAESAVAAGVRRIEAVSGKAAEAYINNTFNQLSLVKDLYNNPKELIKQIENSLAETKELKKKIESLEAKQLVILKAELLTQVEKINDNTFIGKVLELSNADGLKKLASELIATNDVVVLAANIGGKASVAIALSENLVAKGFEVPKIIKEHITPIIKGGGGGQKNLATAGGQDASNLNKVIEVVKGLL
jgi:alanyl-tRNA synthetase